MRARIGPSPYGVINQQSAISAKGGSRTGGRGHFQVHGIRRSHSRTASRTGTSVKTRSRSRRRRREFQCDSYNYNSRLRALCLPPNAPGAYNHQLAGNQNTAHQHDQTSECLRDGWSGDHIAGSGVAAAQPPTILSTSEHGPSLCRTASHLRGQEPIVNISSIHSRAWGKRRASAQSPDIYHD